jgi:hypothetical protein
MMLNPIGSEAARGGLVGGELRDRAEEDPRDALVWARPPVRIQSANEGGASLLSIGALVSTDESLLSAELRHATTRRQIALVRSIVDALEHYLCRMSSPGREAAMNAQLCEELARRGCGALEAAPLEAREEESGVYRVR